MVKSTKVSNKYDLLDDVETNVKAEIDEDEDEKKKEKEKESEKESSVHALPQTPHTAPRLCLTARRARRSSNRSRPSLSVATARRPAAPRR